MNQQTNPQLDLALSFVQHTNRNIFLTGKAGTGKTTFLRQLKNATPKRMVIVAPTGVAAINAGGVTIHSFFQLPFAPHIPNHNIIGPQTNKNFNQKINKQKINLIKSLDLLIIDEISMVRADLLDAIDEVLRRYKDRNKPFGGTQLLMIGDLHQLSPVVKDDEWNLLKDYYQTVYFFSSLALQQSQPISIELKHIYRQADKEFIEILNQIRNKQVNDYTLEKLNKRFIPNFKPSDDDGYIILTTHNARAAETNEGKLKAIKHKAHTYKATIEGDFPTYLFPNDLELQLKVDSQVMFIKNDSTPEKLFYNGKIGRITKITDDEIVVKCPTDNFNIIVPRMVWENTKYELNSTTKEIKESIIGKFTQYPLKLAWAITIHKSQGLTFEKAIIDANASFAHGQVYVALSRCKTLEGMVLQTPINNTSIRTDSTISAYTTAVEQNEPDAQQLQESMLMFQESIIKELFTFKRLEYRFNTFKQITSENNGIIDQNLLQQESEIDSVLKNDILQIADKFILQIEQLSNKEQLPEENQALQERIQKGSIYFTDKLQILEKFAKQFSFETDNKEIKKNIHKHQEALQLEVYTKLMCLKKSADKFNTVEYLQTKANAEIDFVSSIKPVKETTDYSSRNIPNSALYAELREWRDSVSVENEVDNAYMILPYKAMLELVTKLPTSYVELSKIKGIGKVKVKQFGAEILSIITTYCLEHGITEAPKEVPEYKEKKNSLKPDTKKISYDFFTAGKSIDEIAIERGLNSATIEGHLAHYVGTGELDVYTFVDKHKVYSITDYLTKNKTTSLNTIRQDLGDNYSYSEIKFVVQHLKQN